MTKRHAIPLDLEHVQYKRGTGQCSAGKPASRAELMVAESTRLQTNSNQINIPFLAKEGILYGTINGITGLTVPLCVVFATCCCRERPTAWQSSLRATHRSQDGHDKFKSASPALFLGGWAPCTGSNVTNDVPDGGDCRSLQGLCRLLAYNALPGVSTLHGSWKQRVWQWQRR